MRQKADKFQRLGARVVLVGLGTPEETAAFKEQFNVPFTMIADPQKRLFKAFHLKQASLGGLFSVGMAVKGLSAMAKGHAIGIPKGDVRQLPGVFIIDSGGRIRFSHFAKDPADHPDPDDLLAFLRDDN
ncbi:MAG: redoxin domain-containing protein [Desulfosarcina sp.]|nr:redoxin domain-containing protein [Desulfosarcina sp.]